MEETIYKQITLDEINELHLRLHFVKSVNEVLDELAFADSFDNLPEGTISCLTSEARIKIEEIEEILSKKEAK